MSELVGTCHCGRVRITLPRKPEKGWKLVVDPDRRVAEIYEGNNAVALEAM